MSDFISTPVGSAFPPKADPTISATSVQYGPAWVADCYGTTHEERLTEVLRNSKTTTARASWRKAPRDEVAKAYSFFTEEVAVTLPTEEEPELVTSFDQVEDLPRFRDRFTDEEWAARQAATAEAVEDEHSHGGTASLDDGCGA